MHPVFVEDVKKKGSVLSDLMASSFYLDMLNDRHRNACYMQALQKVVRPGQCVLDIGTGSGLLSLMASKFLRGHPESSVDGSIVACEVFQPMVALAEEIVQQNSLQGSIHLVSSRSDDLPVNVYGKKFDVIVTEIFDSELIGEGLLNTMRHAMQHLAKENAIVVPSRATVYCQIVSSPVLKQWKDEDLKPGWMASLKDCDLSPLHPHFLTCLSRPVSMFDFDLAHPPPSDRAVELKIPILSEGEADAVVVWWNLDCDPDGLIQLSTQPDWMSSVAHPQRWRQHWKQCWAPLPASKVEKGACITLRCEHDDLNISIGMQSSDAQEHPSTDSEAVTWKPFVSIASARRLWELADDSRKGRYQEFLLGLFSSLEESNEGKSRLHILVLGEGSLFGELIAQQEKFPKPLTVTLVQESLPGFKAGCARMHLWTREDCTFRCIRLENLNEGSETLPDLEKVDCVLSEPYFWSKEGQEPWMHYLMLKHCIELLRSGALLTENCQIYPSGLRLVCCGVSLPDLHRTRQRLDRIEDWDLSLLNVPLGAIGHGLPPLPSFPASVWQCGRGFVRLTEKALLSDEHSSDGEWKFEGAHDVSLPLLRDGVCHAIVIWPEYYFGTPPAEDSFIGEEPAGMPHYAVHGICLLPDPVAIGSLLQKEETREVMKIRITSDVHTFKFTAAVL